MVKVVGVRFRTEGKIYFFDPMQLEIKRGDDVIVESAGGYEFGKAVSGIREVEEDAVVAPLKPILRIATQRDQEQERQNKEKEKEAFRICQEKIKKHGLEMKLINADYAFDNSKLLFHFTADGRVDFRELVKDLASVFKTRIELRQIGVRDETRFLGGIGICGRQLCCCTYLSDLNKTVSIKMAKEQNLSLNPTKISGACGRLMCCLRNEEETYEELNKKLPNVGDYVVTPDGQKGEVHSVNVLRQLVKVLVGSDDDKELKEYEVDSLKFRKHHGKKEKQDLSPEELKELEILEKEEEEEMEAAIAAAGERAEKKEGGERRGEHRNKNLPQKRDKNERPEKGDRQKGDRQNQDRNEKADRRSQGKPDRNDKQGRGEKPSQDRAERGEKQGRGERPNQDRAERGEKQGRGGRQNQERTGQAERQNQEKNRQFGNAERGEGKRDKRDRQDRQAHGRGDNQPNRQNRDKNRFANRERQDPNRQQNNNVQNKENQNKENQKRQSGGEE